MHKVFWQGYFPVLPVSKHSVHPGATPSFEKRSTYLAGKSLSAIIFFDMDRIDTDVVTIQDAEASGNDLARFSRQKHRWYPLGLHGT